MTLVEAIERINRGVGFRPALDKQDVITQCLQDAQRELEMGKSLPQFLIIHDALLTFTNGDNIENLPVGFIREDETEPVRCSVGVTVRKLIPRQYWDAFKAFGASVPGSPMVYVIRRRSLLDATGKMLLFPVPDASYAVAFSYYKEDTILSGNIENAWLKFAPELLIGEAGYRYAKDLGHAGGAEKFDDMRKQARASVFAEVVLQDDTGTQGTGVQSLGSSL